MTERMMLKYAAAVLIFIAHSTTSNANNHGKLVLEECWETHNSAEAVRRGDLAAAPPPSVLTPFLFLHVPKTGGSTIRGQLVAAAKRLGLGGERTAPVGGHQPRHELYDHKVGARQAKEAALMAGHLTWGTLNRMQQEFRRFDLVNHHQSRIQATSFSSLHLHPTLATNDDDDNNNNNNAPLPLLPLHLPLVCGDDEKKKREEAALITAAAASAAAPAVASAPAPVVAPSFSCLTILRHPLERTISYYYNRISKTVALSSLSPDQLRHTLLSFRKDGSRRFNGNQDEGPVQPTFKMLCGNWTAASNEWSTHGCDLNMARRRLQRCFVGVLDEWIPKSCAVLDAQLPWINLNCSTHENDHHHHHLSPPPPPPSPPSSSAITQLSMTTTPTQSVKTTRAVKTKASDQRSADETAVGGGGRGGGDGGGVFEESSDSLDGESGRPSSNGIHNGGGRSRSGGIESSSSSSSAVVKGTMRGERKQKKRQGEKTASKEKEVRKNEGSSSSRRRRKLVSTTTVEVVLEHETRLTLPPELAAVIMSLNKDELVLYQDALATVERDYQALNKNKNKNDQALKKKPLPPKKKKKKNTKDLATSSDKAASPRK